MMKLYSAIIFLFSVGCSGAPDAVITNSSPDETEASQNNQRQVHAYAQDTPYGGGGCAKTVMIVKVEKDNDGSYRILELEMSCNPGYRYTGDPSPDRKKIQVVDPQPF